MTITTTWGFAPGYENAGLQPASNSAPSPAGLNTGRKTLLLVLVLLSAMFSHPSAIAQTSPQIFSVAAARQNAAQLRTKQISVKGHFWYGKEGSMIYDSYHKAILRLQYSDAFNAKHDLDFLLHPPKRKSNIATVTGHLQTESNGRLSLIADDIQFSENSSTSTHPN